MEAASAKLKRRIDAFEKHVASCRSSFDVGLLYRMLRIFSESQRSEITGLAALRGPQARGGGGHLGTGQRAGPSGAGHGRGHVGGSEGGRQLRGGQIGNGQGGRGHLGGPQVESSEVRTYLTWLAEYVRYLVILKKVFDERIFIPLCENLYLNEGSVQVPAPNRHCVGSAQSTSSGVFSRPSTDVSSCDSQDSSSAEHHHQGHDDDQHLLGGPQRSVPRIAKCLFRLRKQWALLLRGDELRDEYFSAESGPALLHFQGCGSFYKVLRLVPDIFCKALRAARLCREWVDAHSATLATVHAIGPAAPGTLSSELPQLEMSEMSVSRCDRVDELKRSVDSSKARLMALNEELEARRSERDLLEERLGALLPGADDMGRVALQERLEVARSRIDVLGSAIRLERYRQRLLVGDWLAELESQPDRIRHADRV
ncbi:uncharacterized protein LOC133358494 [Lethenteron reissneri]|uniref:uncharacterized protein LOC133358494 n=1 Tax=Lethenteron reissneri TaxID=7753 RepID=UPI002AB60E23|nr:uncharacterized protein LOC133358494 [Lethenteron reissneri]